MLQRVLCTAFVLFASSAWAVTGGFVLLPTAATDGKSYSAHFGVGLSVDAGNTWQSAASVNQQVLIKGSVDADPAHVGLKADVFVVELAAGQFTMLTTDGTWLSWSGNVADLQPAQEGVLLSATNDVTIFVGPAGVAGQHSLFIGYLPANSSALIYSPTPANFEFNSVADPIGYFEAQIFEPIVMQKCAICHVAGGPAASSDLHFVRDSNLSRQNYDIFAKFYAGENDAYNYLLSKVSGGSGHGGGQQLPVGSSDYQKFASFLDLLEGSTSTGPGIAQGLFDGVDNQSRSETLHDAALLLAGRLPTTAEQVLVTNGDDDTLKQVLLAMMQGAHFHQFIKDGANDRLLLRGTEDANFLDDCGTCFPALNEEYWRLKDKADLSGLAPDRTAVSTLVNQFNFSFMESPLELIAYVVENNKPYSEILTADYDMLTPAVNAVVGGTASFAGATGVAEFKPGKIQSYYHRDSGTVTQQVVGAALPRLTTPSKLKVSYPHVGLLNSKSFLSRYPTTATNRNRARARWTYYNFLGVDIEALALRTTDPVALADTNNPTMNNPACMVCHSVLDPVAGTFQDYSDNGIYKNAVNGTDSLDRFYKATKTGAAVYKTGDTWYRDMRNPGFEGSTAAAGNTLRWLAEQIVKDPRFTVASVRFWWPAVIGSELLTAPEAKEDQNYQARLQAYEAQQAEIQRLADNFAKSGLSVKNLLADLVLSKWYRADKLTGTPISSVTSSARSLARVSSEKLLTPEQLGHKTQALTGFNWNAQPNALTSAMESGLENDYNTFYGGIDGFAIKQRARSLTPMMSNVAIAHALETSCPIVLGDFIRPDAQRLLFTGLSPWLTPLTEQATTFTMSSSNESDFKPLTVALTLDAGMHQIVLSHLNDACDYSVSASTCKQDKNLVIDSLTIKRPNGLVTTLTATAGSYGNCAAVTSNNRVTLYSSCAATYAFTADLSGSYTLTASLAAKQSSSDPVLAGLNVDATVAPATAITTGATALKAKLVELHSKLLGQTVTVTSPEVLASYDLLVQTWLSRKASAAAPSLLQKTLACDWSTDIGFIGTLAYPGSPLQSPTRYKTAEVTTWLTPQAQDTLLMKQSWVVVMAYLLSHYDYLHE
jgi:hypothetical protein